MKPIPANRNALMMEASAMGLSPSMIHSNSEGQIAPRVKLLQYCYNSWQNYRNLNRVSLMLFGTSGSGKSSTINHLLGFETASISDHTSETRNTTEFVLTVEDPSLDVSNLTLGIIDTPGFNDTSGPRQDDCNLMSVKKFCKRSVFLSHSDFLCRSEYFPNIVLLVIQATENRFFGEQSNFRTTLRTIRDELRVIDRRHPNVVVVITFCCSLPRGSPSKWRQKLDEKSSQIRQLLREETGIDNAPVVFIENNYEDYDLQMSPDRQQSKLPDGSWQPKNLFLAISNLLKRNNDDLGLSTFKRLFALNMKTVKAEKGLSIGAKIASSCLDMMLLSSTERPVLENQRENSCRVGNSDSFEKSLCGQYALSFIGKGYNIISDEPVTINLFNVDASDIRGEIDGITLPLEVNITSYPEQQIRTFMNYIENHDEYTTDRLFQLGLEMDLREPPQFKMKPKAGFFIAGYDPSKTIEGSFLYERRLFRMRVSDLSRLKLTDSFILAVHRLPEFYDSLDYENNELFKKFFEVWGHLVIVSAYGGGSVEVKTEVEWTANSVLAYYTVMEKLETKFRALSMGSNGHHHTSVTSEEAVDDTNTNAAVFRGGDSHHLAEKLEDISPEDWNQWETSLARNPVLLTTEMLLAPVYDVVRLVDSMKAEACQRAFANQIGEFTINRSHEQENATSSTLAIAAMQFKTAGTHSYYSMGLTGMERETETDRAKIADSQQSNDKRKCFPGNSTVRVKGEIKPKLLKDLTIGDEVLAFEFTNKQLFYSQLYTFAHYDSTVSIDYLHIKTDDGKCIAISKKHIILSNGEMVFAEQVQVGDFLCAVQETEQGSDFSVVHVKVVEVNIVSDIGCIAPFTLSGTIVVDDVMASCYAHVNSFSLAHTCLTPLRCVYLLGMRKILAINRDDEKIPVAVRLMIRIMRMFLTD